MLFTIHHLRNLSFLCQNAHHDRLTKEYISNWFLVPGDGFHYGISTSIIILSCSINTAPFHKDQRPVVYHHNTVIRKSSQSMHFNYHGYWPICTLYQHLDCNIPHNSFPILPGTTSQSRLRTKKGVDCSGAQIHNSEILRPAINGQHMLNMDYNHAKPTKLRMIIDTNVTELRNYTTLTLIYLTP